MKRSTVRATLTTPGIGAALVEVEVNAVLLLKELTTTLGRNVSSSSWPVFGFSHCESIRDRLDRKKFLIAKA